jgi:hypothetical protein
MGFNFVGGSGLANPVDTLQNALSFWNVWWKSRSDWRHK